MNLAVLASGSGTILESILDNCEGVVAVVADRSCRALDVAKGNGIESLLVKREDFSESFNRDEYTSHLVEMLKVRGVDLVAMAGFGTILSHSLYIDYDNRVLNTHPSLLPAFPGWHSVRTALHYGVKVTGCTVHLATEVVDDGPILAQMPVPVVKGDDEQRLHERIKAVERRLYPAVISSYLKFLSDTNVRPVDPSLFWFDLTLVDEGVWQ